MKTSSFLAVALLLAALSGCSAYKLRGVVLYGERSAIEVVDDKDPRLSKGSPIEEASIMVTLDPDTLRPKFLGEVFPNERGEFAMPVEETGAGILMYDVYVLGSAPGFSDANATIPLPGSGSRLLITLAPGNRHAPARDRLLDEFERNKRQFN